MPLSKHSEHLGQSLSGIKIVMVGTTHPGNIGAAARIMANMGLSRLRLGLKLGTIADLIRYRMQAEPTVWRISEHVLKTRHGDFRAVIYEDGELKQVHMALVHGSIQRHVPTLVRVQTHRGVSDMLSESLDTYSWSVDSALARIAGEDSGILVLLTYSENAAQLDCR